MTTTTTTDRAFPELGEPGTPKPLARLASSPAALAAALHMLDAFERTGLAPVEREVVALTVARTNGCRFCVALHTQLLGKLPGGPAMARALVAGERLGDERLAALQAFVEDVLARTGDVGDASWAALRAAGFTHADALDVVLGVGAYTLTTFANRLTQA